MRPTAEQGRRGSCRPRAKTKKNRGGRKGENHRGRRGESRPKKRRETRGGSCVNEEQWQRRQLREWETKEGRNENRREPPWKTEGKLTEKSDAFSRPLLFKALENGTFKILLTQGCRILATLMKCSAWFPCAANCVTMQPPIVLE